jgi:hypothetical protein
MSYDLPPTFEFTSKIGIPFLVRLVPPGAPYGHNMRQVNVAREAFVEFYDYRYDFCHEFIGSNDAAKGAGAKRLGQFITKYYLSTLLESRPGPLCLNGGIPVWTVDGDSMEEVRKWLCHVVPGCHKRTLPDRELATVLSALRYWQQALAANGEPPIVEYFSEVTPLTSDEIDTLFDILNS